MGMRRGLEKRELAEVQVEERHEGTKGSETLFTGCTKKLIAKLHITLSIKNTRGLKNFGQYAESIGIPTFELFAIHDPKRQGKLQMRTRAPDPARIKTP